MIYKFFNARVNCYGILWSSTQNKLRIHIKIWFYTTLTIEELLDLRAHGRVFKQPQLPQRIRDTQPLNAIVWKWIYSWWMSIRSNKPCIYVHTCIYVPFTWYLYSGCLQLWRTSQAKPRGYSAYNNMSIESSILLVFLDTCGSAVNIFGCNDGPWDEFNCSFATRISNFCDMYMHSIAVKWYNYIRELYKPLMVFVSKQFCSLCRISITVKSLI